MTDNTAPDDEIINGKRIPTPSVGDTISYAFQKSGQYRTIHLDGAWGGMTPRGGFALSFYSERLAIPKASQRTVIAVEGQGMLLSPETPSDVRQEIIRSVEITALMEFRAAQELYILLQEQIGIAEEQMQLPEESRVVKK